MVVAAIAGEWFPYDRRDRWFFFLSDCSDHSDHMETKPYCDKSWKDLQQASRETGRFTRRIGPRRLFTLGYMGLSLQQLCTRSILSFFVEFFAADAWLRRAIQPNFTFYWEPANKRRRHCLSHSLCPWIFFWGIRVQESLSTFSSVSELE